MPNLLPNMFGKISQIVAFDTQIASETNLYTLITTTLRSKKKFEKHDTKKNMCYLTQTL